MPIIHDLLSGIPVIGEISPAELLSGSITVLLAFAFNYFLFNEDGDTTTNLIYAFIPISIYMIFIHLFKSFHDNSLQTDIAKK